MKYLNAIGFFLLFAFIAILIVAAESKNANSFIFSEFCAFAGIVCIAIANRKQKVLA
ncbi:MAG TPA: hypothetical protein PLQ20_03160 [Candidatus Paceibacterota bacterium]|nr:hypothetical protein [Candidatus Paceibacterota bacterium]